MLGTTNKSLNETKKSDKKTAGIIAYRFMS